MTKVSEKWLEKLTSLWVKKMLIFYWGNTKEWRSDVPAGPSLYGVHFKNRSHDHSRGPSCTKSRFKISGVPLAAPIAWI